MRYFKRSNSTENCLWTSWSLEILKTVIETDIKHGEINSLIKCDESQLIINTGFFVQRKDRDFF